MFYVSCNVFAISAWSLGVERHKRAGNMAQQQCSRVGTGVYYDCILLMSIKAR